MGRKENRREDRRLQLLLLTAAVNLVASMVNLIKNIIDWLQG